MKRRPGRTRNFDERYGVELVLRIFYAREVGPLSPSAPAFPFAGGALAPLRAAAEAAGSDDFTNQWSGQSARLAPRLPSGELTRKLAADALAQFHRLAASTTTL